MFKCSGIGVQVRPENAEGWIRIEEANDYAVHSPDVIADIPAKPDESLDEEFEANERILESIFGGSK